jgi:hypothetical protein
MSSVVINWLVDLLKHLAQKSSLVGKRAFSIVVKTRTAAALLVLRHHPEHEAISYRNVVCI